MYRSTTTLLVVLGCLWLNGGAGAGEYSHSYGSGSWWAGVDAWTPIGGSPIGVPGEFDTANVYAEINMPESAEDVTKVGTLNVDTYYSWGPPGSIQMRSGTFEIMDGGQWMWGGFGGFYGGGVVNQRGTFVLVDDIADHVNNGAAVVDAIDHGFHWGISFNNYGTMQHDSLGAFSLGTGGCKYNNYGTHDFTTDGDIVTGGQGGETTTNYSLIKKSGGVGESLINGEFINNGTVEVLTGRITVNHSLQYDGWWSHELRGGKWVIEDGADVVIAARGELFTNQGHVVLNGSGADLYTTQTYTYTSINTSLMTNEGTLEIYGDRTFSNAITNTGTLKVGHETTVTADIINSGEMSPGNSPGRAVIDGDFAQAGDGELTMELAGYTPGVQFDVLEVTGVATLDGILNLSYIDFTALPGDTFLILDAGGLQDEFSNVIFPDSQDWFIDYEPTAGDVTVGIVVPEPASLAVLAMGAVALIRRRKYDC